jgi:hypothetical protein
MYEYTDKVMKGLATQMANHFSRLKLRSVLAFDELNTLNNAVKTCYAKCMTDITSAYLKIARHYYKKEGGDAILDALYIEAILKDFDPVTKYIFNTEYDRKRSRAFEAIAVTKNAKEVDNALKVLFEQVKQWGDNVTDDARMKAFVDRGLRDVRWKTEEDSRVCKECGERNNVIYPVNKVPPKPHIRCRCYLIPVKISTP